MSLQGIRNVPPNGVFGNEVYGSDSEGFGMNPSSNEFRLCNSDEWRSGNHSGRVIIPGYGGGGDMVIRHRVKGYCSCSCVDGILVDGSSGSIDVDISESAISTALGCSSYWNWRNNTG
ncbi:hypothetical protein Tco_0026139 [Tanacetum coccineum]